MSADSPDPNDLPPATREALDSLGGALGDLAELDEEQLAETTALLKTLGHDEAADLLANRRDVLKTLGAVGAGGLVGAAGVSSATGRAEAGTNQAGTIGTPSNPVDVEAEDVNAAMVDADAVHTEDVLAKEYDGIAVNAKYWLDNLGASDIFDAANQAASFVQSNLGKGTVLIPEPDSGTWSPTTTLEWKSGVEFLGTGTPGTQINYDGTGWAVEHPDKANSSVSEVGLDRVFINTPGASGIDLNGVQQARVGPNILVAGDKTAGTIGIRTGNATDSQASWWNRVAATRVQRYDTGVQLSDASNRVAVAVARIQDSGAYGLDVQQTTQTAYLQIMDITGATSANARIDGKVYGYVAVEDSSGQGAYGFHLLGNSGGILHAPVYSSPSNRWKWEAGAGIRLTHSNGTVSMPPRSATPDTSTYRVYLDDGTNTADGNPHLRWYNGTSYVDL